MFNVIMSVWSKTNDSGENFISKNDRIKLIIVITFYAVSGTDKTEATSGHLINKPIFRY